MVRGGGTGDHGDGGRGSDGDIMQVSWPRAASRRDSGVKGAGNLLGLGISGIGTPVYTTSGEETRRAKKRVRS